MRPRELFFNTLLEHAKNDDRVVLLYGDVGGIFLDSWKAALGSRVINAMPSEQNMILVGVGLALEGFKVFVYSIIPFLIYRPFEMIRIYMSHQRLPIRLVGVGSQNSYGSAGYTHWSENDEQIINLCGGIRVFSCYNDEAVKLAAKTAYESEEPIFVRLKR